MAKSKFFRILVEGATTDGRNVERNWITDAAENYNPETYGARINLEHFRGIIPDSPFKAYGDVLALKAEEIAEGDLKGKMALYAQIAPTPALIDLAKAKQKIYTSAEINPKFADTGRAYLVGLAVTDSPASLGTEMLTFAAQNPEKNPLAGRKQDAANLFTAAIDPVTIEMEDEPAETTGAALLKAIKDKLARFATRFTAQEGQVGEVLNALNEMADALEKFAGQGTVVAKQFADQVAAMTKRLDEIEAAGKKATKDFAALRAELEATPNNTQRPPASGGNGQQLTNC